MTNGRSRLIVALDVPDRSAALSAVDKLAGRVGYFKIGLELFISEGPELVREIRQRGEGVFLDLKLHDIPNTVAAAVRAAARLDVQMLTVHAAGGVAHARGRPRGSRIMDDSSAPARSHSPYEPFERRHTAHRRSRGDRDLG